ncbi:DUF6978 family protein, partial [Methylacidiphilum caldifontis]|uniref:DUF6978 family protein n=1 Tax=Methylacidiphilum caldifontis TaxID=2795386 RepID=UPI001ABCADFE
TNTDAQFIYKAVAKVLLSQSGDTSTLDLVLTYNFKARTFVFILRYAHRENIRRLEFNKPHRNPGRSREHIGKLHKHTWTDAYEDTWAYEPKDIEDPWDLRRSLGNFLTECKIEYEPEQLGTLQVQGRWI